MYYVKSSLLLLKKNFRSENFTLFKNEKKTFRDVKQNENNNK